MLFPSVVALVTRPSVVRPLRNLLAASALLVAWLAFAIDRAGVADSARRADVIVVLGARVQPDGQPSPTLRARAEHGVQLYRRGFAPKLLFSGGVGDFGGSEAAAARAIALSLGVPARDCLVEEASHSTAQNAAFSTKLLRERGLTRVVVATDPYHLPRALRFFRGQGLAAAGSPVLAAPRHRDVLSRLYWTLREVAALAESGAP